MHFSSVLSNFYYKRVGDHFWDTRWVNKSTFFYWTESKLINPLLETKKLLSLYYIPENIWKYNKEQKRKLNHIVNETLRTRGSTEKSIPIT